MIKNLTNILSKKKKSSLNILFICSMMVNFMCQLGQAIVPTYSVKCYSGCFCEGNISDEFKAYISKLRVTIQNVGGPHLIVEGLNRERAISPEQEGILPAGCLWTPQLFPACQLILLFGLTSPHNVMRQFLKISCSLYISIFTSSLSPFDSVSGEH